MSELVADCPRCGASKITFDVKSSHYLYQRHNWQTWSDGYSICRNCNRSTVFILSQKEIGDNDYLRKAGIPNLEGSLNNYFRVEGFVSLKDTVRHSPPEHLPATIKAAFEEGATCMAVNCYNAGATMFRLCIDHATKVLLPEQDTNGLNRQIRRSLGHRLKWLFNNDLLPVALRELSSCIKEDGNDGAHDGTLSKEDAEDLLDFTFVILDRLYTEPERLRLAQIRRDARRTT